MADCYFQVIAGSDAVAGGLPETSGTTTSTKQIDLSPCYIRTYGCAARPCQWPLPLALHGQPWASLFEHVLSRRLQSQVYYRGLAASMRQARQLVVHGHIGFGEQKMTVPGYILTRDEEATLSYHHTSPLVDASHPIRQEIDAIRATADYGEDDEEEGGEA